MLSFITYFETFFVVIAGTCCLFVAGSYLLRPRKNWWRESHSPGRKYKYTVVGQVDYDTDETFVRLVSTADLAARERDIADGIARFEMANKLPPHSESDEWEVA